MTTANWIPFAATSSQRNEVSVCDVKGYFTVEKDSATFRGRNLKGSRVDLGPFNLFCDESRLTELSVWNHDDQPLRSDVVPQAVNLASIQQLLGSSSGILE